MAKMITNAITNKVAYLETHDNPGRDIEMSISTNKQNNTQIYYS